MEWLHDEIVRRGGCVELFQRSLTLSLSLFLSLFSLFLFLFLSFLQFFKQDCVFFEERERERRIEVIIA